MDWRFILSLLLAIVVAIFAIQNAETVDVNFFSMTLSISQALIILISAVLGAIAAMLFGIIRWVKLKSQINHSTKTISVLEAENNLLTQKLQENTDQKTDEVGINQAS